MFLKLAVKIFLVLFFRYLIQSFKSGHVCRDGSVLVSISGLHINLWRNDAHFCR